MALKAANGGALADYDKSVELDQSINMYYTRFALRKKLGDKNGACEDSKSVVNWVGMKTIEVSIVSNVNKRKGIIWRALDRKCFSSIVPSAKMFLPVLPILKSLVSSSNPPSSQGLIPTHKPYQEDRASMKNSILQINANTTFTNTPLPNILLLLTY
jgi:hypothetical protein